MICVWTGPNDFQVDNEIHPAWKPFEIDVNGLKWLAKRRVYLTPLLGLDDALELISGSSEATVSAVLKQCKLENANQLLDRLGVKSKATKGGK